MTGNKNARAKTRRHAAQVKMAQTDFDSPWKEILIRYFPEFMAFFFPAAYEKIDWTREYAFLDKELRQVVREAETGGRRVDALVRVVLKENREEAWVLTHVEVQGDPEISFEERMYIYNYRLFDRYRRRVASFAVLTDDNPRWRPDRFSYELLGSEIFLRFSMTKLLDYKADWQTLTDSTNPFAIVTMAHLQTQETRHNLEDRYAAKLTLAKMLYKKGYGRQDVLELFRFIDWVMNLPLELEEQFMTELVAYEEQEKKPYLAPFERIAIQKGVKQGIEQGIEQGLQEGERQASYNLLVVTLETRFGEIPEELVERLTAVTDTTILQDLHRKAILAESLDEFVNQIPHA